MSSEVAPGRIKAGIVAIVFGGYSGGNFINAFVQAFVLDAYGWQGAFWMGGVLGIVLFVVLLVFLPESIRFRAGRNSADPEIGRALCKFDPTLRFSGEERFVLDEVKKKKQHAPVVSLFKDGLLVPTLLLWLTYIAVFTVSHLSGAWNTTVLHNMAGLSFKYLASMTALATIAGIFGTMTSGFVIDRFGPVRAMPFFFIGAAIFHAAFGLINLNSAMFYVVGVLSSYFSNSGLGSVNVLGAILYSSRIRATGVSWATGAGRFGGMLGPIIGGGMLAAQWNITTIYLVVGTPLFIAAFAIIAMGWSAPALRKGRVANEKDALAEPLVSKTTGALNS
jgi:AAHS family 4-hydroxybenzoate transporter-like MFS transporter